MYLTLADVTKIFPGRGGEGEAPEFRNDLHHNSATQPARIGDLVVGSAPADGKGNPPEPESPQ